MENLVVILKSVVLFFIRIILPVIVINILLKKDIIHNKKISKTMIFLLYFVPISWFVFSIFIYLTALTN